VRLVIARCSVDYIGRLTAHLPMATRLLLVKADGSVSVHSDDRAYKPLNWMSPPCRLEETEGVWHVVNKAGEELRISIEEILHDTSHELGIDPGLVKDGVEAHLQELLALHVTTFGDGWTAASWAKQGIAAGRTSPRTASVSVLLVRIRESPACKVGPVPGGRYRAPAESAGRWVALTAVPVRSPRTPTAGQNAIFPGEHSGLAPSGHGALSLHPFSSPLRRA